MGNQLADQVSTAKTRAGILKAEKLGKPEAGSSQTLLNLKAAAWHLNPVVAAMAGKGPFHEKGKEVVPESFDEAVERAKEVTGPANPKLRGPKEKIRR
jgi:hypothetical protein